MTPQCNILTRLFKLEALAVKGMYEVFLAAGLNSNKDLLPVIEFDLVFARYLVGNGLSCQYSSHC